MKPAAIATMLAVAASSLFADDAEVLLEEFDGDLTLKWNVVREDKSHYSLTSHPGEIALTTQAGSMYANNEGSGFAPAPKNIFLMHDAIPPNQDFDATLHVSRFDPNMHFQQIAMLMYQSDQHYLKWEASCREAGDPRTVLTTVTESNNVPVQNSPHPIQIDGPLWLRLSRRGKEYRASYSDDGDSFTTYFKIKWELDPKAKRPRIGYVAKNGNDLKDETTVVVESFEFRPVAASK